MVVVGSGGTNLIGVFISSYMVVSTSWSAIEADHELSSFVICVLYLYVCHILIKKFLEVEWEAWQRRQWMQTSP